MLSSQRETNEELMENQINQTEVRLALPFSKSKALMDINQMATIYNKNKLNRQNRSKTQIVKDVRELQKDVLCKIYNKKVLIKEENLIGGLPYSCIPQDARPCKNGFNIQNCKFCVYDENHEEVMIDPKLCDLKTNEIKSNHKESDHSDKSQQYHHESSSKSKRKDDDSNESNENNNRSNGRRCPNGGNQDNDWDKDNSEGTQFSDYEDEFEEIVDGHKKYIKANRKAFGIISDDDYIEVSKKEEQFNYFTQNTKEQSILSQNDLFKTLWINCMKTDKEWLKKYTMGDKFNSLCLDNIEVMLDFANENESFYAHNKRNDTQQCEIIDCILNLEIKQIESLTLRASNQQIDEDIKIHFNALNLYLFDEVFSKIRSEYLILENFEFYSSPNHYERQKFAKFIKNALQFYKLEFRNCKFHTDNSLLFHNKYLDQKISIKNCIYSIERNGEVKEKHFNERGIIVTSNNLEDLKKRQYHQERFQNYKSVAGNPHFLTASSRKRSQSLDFQLPCIQILEMDKSESVSLNSSSSDHYESPDEEDFD